MLNKNEEDKLIHQSTQKHMTNEMDAKLYIKLVAICFLGATNFQIDTWSYHNLDSSK